jgi:hypothetical protein
MAFTGKATYTAGSTLPETAEDISDLVAISAPDETPLLDVLGDAARPARSTVHEWLEDALLPNADQVNDSSFSNALTDTTFGVDNADRFRIGDQIKLEGSDEVMLVTATNTGGGTITVTRGYGGTTASNLADNTPISIIGNAALEGDDAGSARFTNRVRKSNFTQIFTSAVEVSGSELAVRQVGVADELDYQKQLRSRELLRDLENAVINGVAPAASPEGSSTIRRTMRGILGFVTTNRFAPGSSGFPSSDPLSEEQLNLAMREVWKNSGGRIDLIVVGGDQKRAINTFVASNRRFTANDDSFRSLISVYESDFGVARILLCRSVPKGTVLLLDSSRIEVKPLAGRSFHYKPLASTGDRENGQVIGEYTLELRNENAHAVISGFAA